MTDGAMFHKGAKVSEDCYVRHVFATPLLAIPHANVDSMNHRLAELILSAEATSASVNQSNQGGWQSEKTLHTWNSPAVSELISLINSSVYTLMLETLGRQSADKEGRTWNIRAWANVNREGAANTLHHHVGGFWSGVYYVSIDAITPAQAGAIVFRPPSMTSILANIINAPKALRDLFPDNIAVVPQSGLLLLFPSWLEHYVLPNNSLAPRISIAFDVIY